MPLRDPAVSAPWSRRSEGVGVALWTSFIVACLETMVIFAFLDPANLGFEALAPSLMALRPMLYGFGFFFLWSFAFIAAGLTAYMLESGPRAAARGREAAAEATAPMASDSSGPPGRSGTTSRP